MRIKPQDLAVGALLALLGGQLLLLGDRLGYAGARPESWISVGDDVSGVLVGDSGGELGSLLGPGPTLLLAFGANCSHCATVAPRWKSWFDGGQRRLRVLAVSSDSAEVAEGFATQHGWDVEVLTVAPDRRLYPRPSLTTRTPWAFVVDETGVVLAEGHGKRLQEIIEMAGISEW